MLKAAAGGARFFRLLCDDSDVFVSTVYWVWKVDLLYECLVQMEKWDGTIFYISATDVQLRATCHDFLGKYALSGCDTVSFPYGNGKLSALKVLLNNGNREEGALLDEIQRTAQAFFWLSTAGRRPLP